MMPGEAEEDIEASILKFKRMFPEKEPSKSQGTGTQVADAPSTGKKTIADEIKALNLELLNPALNRNQKEQIAKKLLSLGNRKMLGNI
jgi:hypothetical protein